MNSIVLNTSVLVLNRSYAAVHVVNVRRAIGLLFRELAEVIHVENGRYANYDFSSWREISELKTEFDERGEYDDWIRSVHFELQVPRILRLIHFDRLPKQRIRLNRRNIFARDANRCQYCGKKFPTNELSLDHVVPTCLGGVSSWENLVCACIKCNVQKGGRTPKQAGIRLITKPVRPSRSPMMTIKLGNPKYESWKAFLDSAYWTVDLQ